MTKILSKQDIFNQVAEHLLTQMKKSSKGRYKSSGCEYKNKDGLRCAVGGLLTDEEINIIKCTGDNDTSVISTRVNLPIRLTNEREFLRRLQIIHDKHKPSRWLEKLSAFAKLNKLDSSVLNKYRKPRKKKEDPDRVLTEQEIFDKVAEHLLTQKKKSVRTKDMPSYITEMPYSCAYRNPNGLKCAVGILITDEEYKSLSNEPEFVSTYTISDKVNRLNGHGFFLGELQQIHDCDEPSRWLGKLFSFAKSHNLDNSVLIKYRK